MIEWSDGQTRVYRPADLRAACPCATCNTERSHSGGERGSPVSVDPEVAIHGMTPVGNYAYKISFSDEHDTGIYSIERLRELGNAGS